MTSDHFVGDEPVIVHQPGMHSLPGYAVVQTTGLSLPGDPTFLPGLEYLMPLDKIFIHQKIKPFRLIRGPNKYIAVDQNEQLLYDIQENDDDWCSRTCFGGDERSFVISFTDTSGREAVRLERQLTCGQSEISVYNGHTFLGRVERSLWSCVPKFRIYSEDGLLIYRVVGLICVGGCSPEFMVCEHSGNEVGLIKKQWAGLMREMFTDIFGVSFPVNMNVRHKALLLSAAILIDFAYFEHNQ